MANSQQPILIIGAGVAGLTLAQACRKDNIPCRVFESDESPSSRGAGWGLTLVQSLPAFRSLVPEDIVERLPEAYVNAEAKKAGEEGHFIYFDLSTGEAKWKAPTAERIRVSRRRLRNLMLTGIDVQWNKGLKDLTSNENGATAFFKDGTSATGSMIVAGDGAHSVARRKLHPEDHENYQLPIRFIGVGVNYPESKVKEVRKLDPYFFQGSDPRTDVFLWFSFLELPGDQDALDDAENGEKMYRCQVMTSWPYREGFFGRVDPSNVPNTDVGQLIWMKSLSAEWAEPFRSVVQDIPDDAEIKVRDQYNKLERHIADTPFKPVVLEDWVPRRSDPTLSNGRIALLGDAQHAMVMYRGEGANQAILDAESLYKQIKPLYQSSASIESKALGEAIAQYEDEAVKRGELAVLASRRACLDAHDWKRLNDSSPIINVDMTRDQVEDERPERG